MLLNREVERLNRRLGESLGMVCAGRLPRYAWAWGPDLVYWSQFLDQQWVMTFWGKPNWSEERWNKEFQGRYRYPANGMYHAYCEWKLPIGLPPNGELTEKAIRLLDEQMNGTFNGETIDGNVLAKELRSVAADMARQEQQRDDEWTEYVQNQNYSAYDTYVQTGYRGEQQNGNV